MKRITTKQLEAVIGRINRIMKAPAKPYIDRVVQIGNYHLSEQYGGYSLHRMVNDSGGIMDVFSCGHIGKRELQALMLAYIEGLHDGAGIGYGKGRS